ncbi:hypothetical protein BDY24DRAFT_337459, partial [Mrakia frigida]|uniref:uncharacterized protein n=1 Tax=Mrakia frigida TaxID=29902 RepID=UPI003FCC111E
NFSSPLYRLNHALLVRVFVPSPEGPWLSDASVVACENELKTSEIFSVLKPGDCVWNTAVNEEGNAGYLLFDGYYLVDLDFQFSVLGEIPSFINAFQFPPSYWHKVVKSAGNPLLYLDLSGPMGVEIKKNTKLILDKAPLTAPDGRERLVQSWIHRSELVVRETKGMIHGDWAGMLVILVSLLLSLSLRSGI